MKKTLCKIIMLAFCAGLLFCLYYFFSPRPKPGDKSFIVEVIDDRGKKTEQRFYSSEEYLGPFMRQTHFIQGVKGSFGFFVTEVDGTIADSRQNAYWNIKINGKDSQTGIDQIAINDGDTFTFTYTQIE